MHMLRRIRRTVTLGAIALLGVAGCGSERTHTEASPVAAAAAAAVPDGGADAILKLSGRIGNHNAGRQLRLTERSLAGLGLRTVELYSRSRSDGCASRACRCAIC